MLAAKIIICVVAILAFWLASFFSCDREYKLPFVICIVLGLVCSIIFCILIITNRNLFTIPKILLFISVCLLFGFNPLFLDSLQDFKDQSSIPFFVGIVITAIAYIIAGAMFLINIEKCTETYITYDGASQIETTTTYYLNNNEDPATRLWEKSKSITYKPISDDSEANESDAD